MRRKSKEEVEEQDKQCAAFHEAGHAVALMAVGGVYAVVHITKNENPAWYEDREGAWTGQATGSTVGFSEIENAVYAVAGDLAENLLYELCYPGDAYLKLWSEEEGEDAAEEWYESREFHASPSDLRAAGDAPPEIVFGRALGLLKERWAQVEEVARELIEKGIWSWPRPSSEEVGTFESGER
jgi:hypothetical protein